jgi:hypothetical protein
MSDDWGQDAKVIGPAPGGADDWGQDAKVLGPAPGAAPAPQEETVGPLWSSKAGRFVQGMGRPIIGAGQLLSHATGVGTEYADRKAREMSEMEQASRKEAGLAPEDINWWGGAGEMLSPVTAIPAARAAKALAAAPSLFGAAGRGMLQGGIYGATQPVAPGADYWPTKTEQVGVGLGTGLVAGPILEGAAKVAAPTVDATVKRMIDRGANTTVGQTLGGWAERAEAALASTPFVGNMIRNRIKESYESLHQAEANDALSHINQALPTGPGAPAPGFETTAYLKKTLGDEFDKLYRGVSINRDAQYAADRTAVKDAAKKGLTPDRYTIFNNDLKTTVEGIHGKIGRDPTRGAGAPVTGQEAQDMLTTLKELENHYRQASSPLDRDIGKYIKQYRQLIDNTIERQNGNFSQDYAKLSKAYVKYLIMEAAGKNPSTWAFEGVPNPTKYAQAVYSVDKSLRKGAGASGKQLMQDWAADAKNVLSAKVPDSGTPERTFIMAALAGMHPITLKGLMGAGIGIPALYNRPVQNALRNYIANPSATQRGIATGLREASPFIPGISTQNVAGEPERGFANGGRVGDGDAPRSGLWPLAPGRADPESVNDVFGKNQGTPALSRRSTVTRHDPESLIRKIEKNTPDYVQGSVTKIGPEKSPAWRVDLGQDLRGDGGRGPSLEASIFESRRPGRPTSEDRPFPLASAGRSFINPNASSGIGPLTVVHNRSI